MMQMRTRLTELTRPLRRPAIVLVVALMSPYACAAGDHDADLDMHQADDALPIMQAKHTDAPVNIDGVLDETVWQDATAYPLALAADRARSGATVQEAGTVKLAWDDENFYVAIEFTESDIVAEGDEDQLPHFQLGDLCELFLRPQDQTWYWELYVTPRGKKTSYWFPGRGRFGLPSNFKYDCGLRVAAQTDGTVNDWQDRDTGWTAEMAMPIKDLTLGGQLFEPGADWRILVARYNYSRYRVERGPELTMSPAMSATNFHLLEDYARLRLTR